MSFHVSFNARTKKTALAHIDDLAGPFHQPHFPDCVREFVRTAMTNISEIDWRPVSVSAAGHLCAGPGSYERSAADIKIAQIYEPTFLPEVE